MLGRTSGGSAPLPDVFTFKTISSGAFSFSIEQSGIEAYADLGDGSGYVLGTNTSGTTWEWSTTYSDNSEKTVSVAVQDFAEVTSIDGILKGEERYVSAFDALNLPNLPFDFEINNQILNELTLPSTGVDGRLEIQQMAYSSNTECIIFSSLDVSDLFFRNNTGFVTWDLTSLVLRGSLNIGQNGGDAGRCVLLPLENNEDFTGFILGRMSNQSDIDMSAWTGSFTGDFHLNNLDGMSNFVPPPASSLDGITSLLINRCRQLSGTIIFENTTTPCNSVSIIANGNSVTFDLTNFLFGGSLSMPFATNASKIILPNVNSEDFTLFEIIRCPDQPNIDLSSWSGNFSGTIQLIGLDLLTSITLPPNMEGVLSLSIATMDNLSGTVIVDNGVGNFTSLNFSTLPNATIDLTNANFSNSFTVYQSSGANNLKNLILPASNSNNFNLFQINKINDWTGTLDLSGFTGVFTGSFQVDRMSNITSLIAPTGNLTGLSLFSISDLNINQSFNLGTDIIAQDIQLNDNNISGSNIDDMISKININVANFPSGAKSIDFGNSGSGSNGTPSSASITTMTNLAVSDDFTFTYWDGSQNVTITP